MLGFGYALVFPGLGVEACQQKQRPKGCRFVSRHDFQDDLDAVTRIDAVPLILDVLCRSTGMGFAAVARVTDDRWIACQVMDQIAFGLGRGGQGQAHR